MNKTLERLEERCAALGITEMRLHSATSSSEAASAWDALGFEVVEHVRRRALPAAGGALPSAHSAVEVR